MENNVDKLIEMQAYEGFIRRASIINAPFMLKGSYVSRQYFKTPNDRIPGDIDWVYLEKIDEHTTASLIFDDWATAVTELELNDDVKFRSFKENRFWRRIDYAMHDDFPTVNSDLKCWVNDIEINFSLDVSFNLVVEQPPVPLVYRPLNGEPFVVPRTVPLSLQVSWKIHQTLVRPRFKDLFDLMHLVQHPSFDNITLENTLKALINECYLDEIDLNKIRLFMNYEIEGFFPNGSIYENWDYWRNDIKVDLWYRKDYRYEQANMITNESKLPINLSIFLKEFESTLKKAGFNSELMKHLPLPSAEAKPIAPKPMLSQSEIEAIRISFNNFNNKKTVSKPMPASKQDNFLSRILRKIFKD